MKKIVFLFTVMLISTQAKLQDVQFPRELTNEGSVLTLFQPQVDRWEEYKKLEFRTAFALMPRLGNEVLGVLYMKANTQVAMETHRVFIDSFTISKINFPSLDADSAKKMEAIVRPFLTPDRSLLMSLEQVVACTPKKESANTITVNNDPPIIFTSTRPTILLSVEGAPVKARAGKENIEYVVNANYPLFFSPPETAWYLYDGLEWQKAKEPGGPWSFVSNLPASLTNLVKDSTWAFLQGTIPAVTTPDKKIPRVFYSEKVAELILFDGEPVYKAIGGTSLKYATNSYSDFFFCASDKQYYYVTSGRWFRSTSLKGPWSYATPDLPADFAKIPESNPAAAILPFVPGTEQAKDAVMIAQIPTTIQVNAFEAAQQVNITYAGEPVFKPIDSTTMQYAANTTEKVLKLSANEYYACVKGIWFFSATPTGPWQTAISVPPVIYAMPVSSPVYNVTYVTQHVTTTNIVEASYTSGYLGVYAVAVPLGVLIIAGTGFYYPPYYYYPPFGYPMYYPYAMTYGMYAYRPYHYGNVAYRASYNPHTGMYGRSVTAYGAYGRATVAQGYNPTTGTYARGSSVSSPYGSRTSAQAYNPYTGASASTRQNSNPHAQWGSTTVRNGAGQSASVGHITTAGGSAAGIRTKNGDMYAGSNGNLYRNTGNGWEAVDRPQSKGAQQRGSGGITQNNAASTRQQPSASQNFNSGEMNREAQNRQRGNLQTQDYSRSRSAGTYQAPQRSSRGGGGRRR